MGRWITTKKRAKSILWLSNWGRSRPTLRRQTATRTRRTKTVLSRFPIWRSYSRNGALNNCRQCTCVCWLHPNFAANHDGTEPFIFSRIFFFLIMAASGLLNKNAGKRLSNRRRNWKLNSMPTTLLMPSPKREKICSRCRGRVCRGCKTLVSHVVHVFLFFLGFALGSEPH